MQPHRAYIIMSSQLVMVFLDGDDYATSNRMRALKKYDNILLNLAVKLEFMHAVRIAKLEVVDAMAMVDVEKLHRHQRIDDNRIANDVKTYLNDVRLHVTFDETADITAHIRRDAKCKLSREDDAVEWPWP